MRLLRILILLLCFSWILPLQAQDELTPYEIALQRIEEARVSGATELNLSNLGLAELPPELWELTNLRVLYLYNNQLGNLPSEIWKLSSLRGLNLFHNQLRSLPPEMGQLHNLVWLDVGNNQLDNLPREIGQLNNLCQLILINNDFRHLPTQLGNITQLGQSEYCHDRPPGLYLWDNPLISPPAEVIEQGTPAILAYLRNQAWWHIKKMIIYAASVIGGLALLFLGLLRWRRARQFGKKKNEA